MRNQPRLRTGSPLRDTPTVAVAVEFLPQCTPECTHSGGPASAYGCEDSVGRALSVSMDSENEVIDEKAGTSLVIPQSVQRAAGDVVHQAFERLISSDVHVTTATEGKRLLAEDDNTEQSTDAIQRFVGIATPVVRIALRGARFTRIPWVLVASTSVSIGVTVRTGVRELQVLAALLAHRFKEETGAQPDAALLRKLTLELYLRPRRTPNVSDVSLPLARLARRWIVSGALGRNTRGKAEQALDAAERLDMAALASRSPVAQLEEPAPSSSRFTIHR